MKKRVFYYEKEKRNWKQMYHLLTAFLFYVIGMVVAIIYVKFPFGILLIGYGYFTYLWMMDWFSKQEYPKETIRIPVMEEIIEKNNVKKSEEVKSQSF